MMLKAHKSGNDTVYVARRTITGVGRTVASLTLSTNVLAVFTGKAGSLAEILRALRKGKFGQNTPMTVVYWG